MQAMLRGFVLTAVVVLMHSEVMAQGVSGVRGMDGGIAPFFELVGLGRYYIDNQGTQGWTYNRDFFQSYSFNTPGGQSWSGALTTLGPNLTIGLIQGANQSGSGVRFPAAPRQTPALPLIQSTIQSMFILQTPPLPQSPLTVQSDEAEQAFPGFDQIP